MLQVMRKFKAGGYNTLISTCVGEEGLDIGEVDLIVCFDAHKSPIRLVQRIGRTGRQREGRIVMLVTEGREHAVCIGMISRINCAVTSILRAS
jgi:Fanconi anemia group M protein